MIAASEPSILIASMNMGIRKAKFIFNINTLSINKSLTEYLKTNSATNKNTEMSYLHIKIKK